MPGFLRLVLGPMFAGKTTDLIKTYNNLVFTESVIAINSKRWIKNFRF